VTSRGGTTAAALEKFANPNFEKIIFGRDFGRGKARARKFRKIF
jgi:hypothetical protein